MRIGEGIPMTAGVIINGEKEVFFKKIGYHFVIS
jgi:hypothetical protein